MGGADNRGEHCSKRTEGRSSNFIFLFCWASTMMFSTVFDVYDSSWVQSELRHLLPPQQQQMQPRTRPLQRTFPAANAYRLAGSRSGSLMASVSKPHRRKFAAFSVEVAPLPSRWNLWPRLSASAGLQGVLAAILNPAPKKVVAPLEAAWGHAMRV